MVIKNISVGVITLSGKHILPQQTISVSDSFASNVVVRGLIKAGRLQEMKSKVEEPVESIVDVEEEFERLLEEKPTTAKMKKFANEHSISIGDAKTFDEIEAVIKAYIAVTKSNG